MTNQKAVFLDIDGTILKPDHTYDTSTKEAILQLQEKGNDVFLATGRPLHEVKELAHELNVQSFIGYNGALAVHQDEVIVNQPMEKKIIEKFIEIATENHHELVLYTSEKNYFMNVDTSNAKHFIDMFQLKQNEIFPYNVANQILGVTLIGLQEADVSLYEIDPSYHFSQVNVDGLRHCYDVIRDHVNKGKAISSILDLLGLKKEDAIAFGDGMNDKEMLSAVGDGFAMGNAHPDLLAYAKHQTKSVSENGIYHGLKSLGLVK